MARALQVISFEQACRLSGPKADAEAYQERRSKERYWFFAAKEKYGAYLLEGG